MKDVYEIQKDCGLNEYQKTMLERSLSEFGLPTNLNEGEIVEIDEMIGALYRRIEELEDQVSKLKGK